MTVDEIQDIIDYAYPRIKNYYGKGKLDYPKIELWNDIYARLSGDPEARGEASKSSKAEFDVDRAIETGKTYIYIYFPNVKDEEDLLRSLIHEYTHYLQDLTKFKEFRRRFSYDKDPYEMQAKKAEKDWDKKDNKGNYLFIKPKG